MKNSSLLTTNKKAQDIYRIILFAFFLGINIAGGIYIFLDYLELTNTSSELSQTIQSKLITEPNSSLYKQIKKDREARKQYSSNDAPPQYSLPSVFAN